MAVLTGKALMQSKMNGMSVFPIMGSPFTDPDESCENLSQKRDKPDMASNGALNLMEF